MQGSERVQARRVRCIRGALSRPLLPALLLALLLAPGAASAQTITALTVEPADFTLPVGFTHTYTAIAHYSNGTTANVSQLVNWSVSSVGVATVTNIPGIKGLVTAVNRGSTRITVEMTVGLQVIRGSTGLTVTDGDLVAIITKPTTKNLEVGLPTQFSAKAHYIDDSERDVTKTVIWSSSDPSVATVSNDQQTKGLVTPHKPGTVVITAFHPESGVSNADGQATVQAKVSHLAFDPPKVVMGRNMQYPLRVYAHRVDGTRSNITDDVEFSVVPFGIVDIGTGDRAGIITPRKNGRVIVSAFDPKRGISTSDSGNDGIIRVFGPVTELVVEPNPMRIAVGEERNARAFGLLKEKKKKTSDLRRIVSWSVSDPSVATVGNGSSDVGQVVGKKAGVVTLRATLGQFQSAQTNNVQVLSELQSVDLEVGDGLIPMNEETELKARGYYEGDIALNISDRCEWTVVNPQIAVVDNAEREVDGDGKGFIRGLRLGQTTVRVNCSGKQSAKNIRVIGTYQGLRVAPAAYEAEALEEKQFRAWGLYSDGSEKDLTKRAQWSSSNPAVATVDNVEDPGTVVGIGTGSATITAVVPPFTASGVVVVGAGIVRLDVVPAAKTLRGSESAKLKAVGRRADNSTKTLTKQVVWSSSDEQVARVSNREGEQGLVIGGGKVGTAQIKATLPGIGFESSATITVNCLLQSFEFNPASKRVPLGRAKKLRVRGRFCDGSTKAITNNVIYTSSNPNVAVVSNEPKSQGTVSAVAPGTAVITAFDPSSGKSATNSAVITVEP